MHRAHASALSKIGSIFGQVGRGCFHQCLGGVFPQVVQGEGLGLLATGKGLPPAGAGLSPEAYAKGAFCSVL